MYLQSPPEYPDNTVHCPVEASSQTLRRHAKYHYGHLSTLPSCVQEREFLDTGQEQHSDTVDAALLRQKTR